MSHLFLYVHQLILRCKHFKHANSNLFHSYHYFLKNIIFSTQHSFSAQLRLLEKKLLEQVGFGYEWSQDTLGCGIEKDFFYIFDLKKGFLKDSQEFPCWVRRFLGQDLLDIAHENFASKRSMEAAKVIFNLAIGVVNTLWF